MCGCTSARAHWVKDLEDKCPSCGKKGDTITHITRCNKPGRRDTFKASVQELTTWIEKNNTGPNLLILISTYLMKRENKTMSEIALEIRNCLPHYYSRLRLKWVGQVQDRLGWDCMLEGRIPALFVDYQRTHLAHTKKDDHKEVGA